MKKLVVLISLFTFTSGAFALGGGEEAKPLDDSNPIVLSHGMLGFSDDEGLLFGLVKYWGGMDEYLRDQGADVLLPEKPALGSNEDRAAVAKEKILLWMAANNYDEVNIIGHSQGSPDSRYMITNLGMANKVGALTSLNGVNYGAPLADIVNAVIPEWLYPFVNDVIGALMGLIWGDTEQDLQLAMGALRVDLFDAFNANTPDAAGVDYFSNGSHMWGINPLQHPFMIWFGPVSCAGGIVYDLGCDNDGLVNVESMKWGTWNGGPELPEGTEGVDHLQATNFEWTGELNFDVRAYFLEMAETMMNAQ